MSLIKSISGIRGTIGGPAGDGLSPLDIVKFTAAYATFIRKSTTKSSNTIVVGRDARLSGEMVKDIVVGTLNGMGFDVVNIGLATTPTTELAVVWEKACGGIILTASHNPKQWNALKLLNEKGEFLNDAEGKEVLAIAEAESFTFAEVDKLGHEFINDTYTRKHIDSVLDLDLVDVEAIKKANFTVAIDAVNSVGGIVMPQLLRRLGVKNVIELNCDPTGNFAHTPEPIPENLTQISDLLKTGCADVGFVVDPDVDRLAIVMETARCLSRNTLSLLWPTTSCQNSGCYSFKPVVFTRAPRRDRTPRMQIHRIGGRRSQRCHSDENSGAVIGGEGNGGVIYPASHYGRDALVGVALFLSLLAHKGKKVSELKKEYPQYCIAKTRFNSHPTSMSTQSLRLLRKICQREGDNNRRCENRLP